jgi:hypothetical protein
LNVSESNWLLGPAVDADPPAAAAAPVVAAASRGSASVTVSPSLWHMNPSYGCGVGRVRT